ncbi:hypothetical protein HG537_0A03350 [Torulaspora globosa]|uniref:RNA helicase n=1 Tax=Torulaspora globosa TaxID=48254 RepID=A0A7H9HJL7_9SACH|nr:hypothetical protein HG537_0A03350 [Torulaspora sp. CBS 2947]
MGTYRKRFNEKARAGHMARLKELKKVRNKQFFRHQEDEKGPIIEENEDSNAVLLKPMSKEEKQLKKRKLEELFAPKESKVSKQKKKRLEKFIEHQLKREEKKVIIEKLQDYKIDTSLMKPLKTLGQGRQTKKEAFQEALSLERQGRGNADTAEILYEEREVKDWDQDHEAVDTHESDDDVESDEKKQGSSFVDRRPSSMGGSGFGFGFSNAQIVHKKTSKPKYSWRQRVELAERRKNDLEDEMDFMSSSEDDEDDESSSQSASDEQNSDSSVEALENSAADDFKNWANQQVKQIEGRDVEIATPKLAVKYEPIIREEDLEDGLVETVIPVDEHSQRKAFYVEVTRPAEIQEIRMKLPVFGEEHKIMEAVHHNDVIIICGETGSGKTTQVPQFLYESGFGNVGSPDYPGMIGITQPRRVAAVSMANRVSSELGDHGSKVGYKIRFDSNLKEDTRVAFMTDGVLLREMMKDFRLTKYSSIIIDEAHERNINTDILIGMLSRCVRLRAKEHSKDPKKNKKLKLIIMSATLRVADFSENTTLFSTPPPILKVDARQFPVAVHFNRRTPYDYMEEAFKKTCKIHRRLPPGAILVFLTGQQEINQMVKRLRREFPFRKENKARRDLESNTLNVKINPKTADLETEDVDLSVEIADEQSFDDGLGSEDDGEDNSEEEEGFDECLEEGQTENDPLYVLPLYSLLPTSEQMKIFKQPPTGSRLCIVATNVAETSLTIPGIKYVVDCGRSKERKYNEETGVQSFEIGWVSKASADQRSGRAGRTGPGHCYRLYSSAVFEHDFEQFSRPEILRMPVESVVLQMKSMAIQNVLNFPFPTPPERNSIHKAINLLQRLGALDSAERITEDGRMMSLFPISPRFSKLLLISEERDCLPYAVTIVSALSVGDPFLKEQEVGLKSGDGEEEEDDRDKEKEKALRSKYFKCKARFSKLDKYSDVFRLLSAICAFDFIPKDDRPRLLRENFLRAKFMDEILKLRKQLMYIIKSSTKEESIAATVTDNDLKCGVPKDIQLRLLKQMICAGFIDQVAIRADFLYPDEVPITHKTSIINIPYVPVLATKTPDISDCFVYIHPSSILTNAGELPPKFLVYHSLHLGNNGKTRMNSLCDIKSTPLANIAGKGSLISYSKPLTGHGMKTIPVSPSERYCYVIPRFGATIDSDLKIGWDLNPVAVHQKKINGQWKVQKIIPNKNYNAIQQQTN